MVEPAPGPGNAGGPNSYPLKPRLEYRAPSFLWEHRYLALVFVLAIIVATVLLFRVPHRQYRGLTIPPPASAPSGAGPSAAAASEPSSEPVYVQPIPERPASSAR